MELEDAANAIIFGHLAKITRHQDKADVLTPWKEQDRRRREVYVSGGTPDPATRKGQLSRVRNERDWHLNSNDGVSSTPKNMGHGPNAWDNE